MSYMTISSQENNHFSLCSYFHAHPTTLYFSKYWGTDAWAVPHLKFSGDRPSVPPAAARRSILVGGASKRLWATFDAILGRRRADPQCDAPSFSADNFLASFKKKIT